MILRGQNVDIILVLIGFSEMRVFSQVSFLNDFFEKSKGEKRTWANPMSSKQWKSLYEIDNFTFLFIYVFFRVLRSRDVENRLFLLTMIQIEIVNAFGR